MNWWENKTVLITGGTGSIGRVLTEILYTEYTPKEIKILSHSEKGQCRFQEYMKRKNIRVMDNNGVEIFPIIQGDIADFCTVELAVQGCDIIIHLAAMKHITICEDNPIETIKVNIEGAKNIYRAAIKYKPKVVLGMSTDKAYNPSNIYGYSKAVMEYLFSINKLWQQNETNFVIVRSGNVLDSDGSVTRIWRQQIREGKSITVTDRDMTRFWITLPDIARFIIQTVQKNYANNIYFERCFPQMAASTIGQLADIFSRKQELIGAKKNERFHEVLHKDLCSHKDCRVDEKQLIKMIKENEPYI